MHKGNIRDMVKVLSLILLVLISFPSTADEKRVEHAVTTTNLSEIEVSNIRLEEQNKLLKSTLSEMRSSYYWSLSFASTFLLLFLGVNVYFFRNRYNDDKDYLLKHINEETSKLSRNTSELIETKFSELKEKIDHHVEEKLKTISSSLDGKISSLKNDIQISRVEIIELSIENTKRTGVEGNVLSEYFKLAQESRKLSGPHWDWQVSESLEEIYKLLCDGAEFDSTELPDVSKFLNTLPDQFSDGVHKVRNKLRDK